jgi:hypothetical protein
LLPVTLVKNKIAAERWAANAGIAQIMDDVTGSRPTLSKKVRVKNGTYQRWF